LTENLQNKQTPNTLKNKHLTWKTKNIYRYCKKYH